MKELSWKECGQDKFNSIGWCLKMENIYNNLFEE
jgi:hypothetical protein